MDRCLGLPLSRVWLLAALMMFGACSSSTPDSDSRTPDDLVYGEQRLDTSEVVSEYERVREVFVESEHAFAECVTGLGYEYELRTLSASFPKTEQFPTFAELRRSFGYGIVDGDGSTGVVIEVDGGSVPAAQHAAFDSEVLESNEGGCMEFYFQTDIQEILNDIRTIEDQPPQRVLADPSLRRPTKHGASVSSPKVSPSRTATTLSTTSKVNLRALTPPATTTLTNLIRSETLSCVSLPSTSTVIWPM